MKTVELKEIEKAVDEIAEESGYGTLEIIIKDRNVLDLIIHKRKRITTN